MSSTGFAMFQRFLQRGVALRRGERRYTSGIPTPVGEVEMQAMGAVETLGDVVDSREGS